MRDKKTNSNKDFFRNKTLTKCFQIPSSLDISVTRFGDISPPWQILKVIFREFTQYLAKFGAYYGKYLNDVNGQILNK